MFLKSIIIIRLSLHRVQLSKASQFTQYKSIHWIHSRRKLICWKISLNLSTKFLDSLVFGSAQSLYCSSSLDSLSISQYLILISPGLLQILMFTGFTSIHFSNSRSGHLWGIIQLLGCINLLGLGQN